MPRSERRGRAAKGSKSLATKALLLLALSCVIIVLLSARAVFRKAATDAAQAAHHPAGLQRGFKDHAWATAADGNQAAEQLYMQAQQNRVVAELKEKLQRSEKQLAKYEKKALEEVLSNPGGFSKWEALKNINAKSNITEDDSDRPLTDLEKCALEVEAWKAKGDKADSKLGKCQKERKQELKFWQNGGFNVWDQAERFGIENITEGGNAPSDLDKALGALEEAQRQIIEMENKLQKKDDQFKKVSAEAKQERKLRARLEDKISILMASSIRARMSVLNVTGGHLLSAEEMINPSPPPGSSSARKAALSKVKRAKLLKAGYSKMAGMQQADAARTLMRSLQAAAADMRANGTLAEGDDQALSLIAADIFQEDSDVVDVDVDSTLPDGSSSEEDVPSEEDATAGAAASIPIVPAGNTTAPKVRRSAAGVEAWNMAVDLSATEVLYDLSLQLPTDRIFTSFGWQNAPPVDEILRGVRKKHKTCALVGNSQRMLLTRKGGEIDAHDAVIRLNQAPTDGFAEYVGAKTTYRLINNFWVTQYGGKEKRVALDPSTKGRLQLEPNVTLIASRTDGSKYLALVKMLEKNRPDVKSVMLAREGLDRIGALLRTIKWRVESLRGLEYAGKGSPSSGFVGVGLMLQLCKHIDVYGVGLAGETTSWHYWEERNFESSREFGVDPHHSFDLERDVLRLLHQAGLVTHQTLPPDADLSRIGDFKTAVHTVLEEAGRIKDELAKSWRKERKGAKEREQGEEGEEGEEEDPQAEFLREDDATES